MAGQRCRFAGDPFHEIAVAADHIDVEVENREICPVVARRQPARRHCHADAIAASLAERSCGGLHAGSVPVFRMAGGNAVDLTELLDIVEADGGFRADLICLEAAHPRQVQHRIQQHGGMPGREHKTVAVGPQRVSGIVTEKLLPQRIYHGGQGHRRARMAGIRLLHRVDGERANGIDA